jgi:recombination protein RecA
VTRIFKEREENVGSRVRAKVVKNKLSAPHKQAEFDLLFGEGISLEGDLIDLAVTEEDPEQLSAHVSRGA